MICITFDTDHMSEEELKKFFDLYKIPGKATIFTHQYYPFLEDAVHEMAPHPLIENLLDWEPGLEALTSNFRRRPYGIRTHSCVFSHMVGISLYRMGYRYISQANNLFQNDLKPLRHPWGIWELPIYYMDNMDFWMSKNWGSLGHQPFCKNIIEQAITGDSLYVFDFHPLHVALNTRSPADYCSVKDAVIKNGISPFSISFDGRGTAVFFEELCAALENTQQVSYTCSEALARFTE